MKIRVRGSEHADRRSSTADYPAGDLEGSLPTKIDKQNAIAQAVKNAFSHSCSHSAVGPSVRRLNSPVMQKAIMQAISSRAISRVLVSVVVVLHVGGGLRQKRSPKTQAPPLSKVRCRGFAFGDQFPLVRGAGITNRPIIFRPALVIAACRVRQSTGPKEQ